MYSLDWIKELIYTFQYTIPGYGIITKRRWIKMAQTSEIVIKIEGMSCGHCKAAVEKALEEVAGVTSAVVNLEK